MLTEATVYTTPAPRGTLTSAAQRRVSEGPPKSAGSGDGPAGAQQQRHLSGSAIQQSARPESSPGHQNALAAQTAALRTFLPSLSPNVAARTHTFSADSPVMNETLSVINEHITDMNTPRSSFANGNKRDTMGSVYSQPLTRMSYIPGHETDEDENLHTEEEVMSWTPLRVAEYLEDHGVEKQHCEVFKDQEISGEVLLAMDQSSIFIKEFDLGSVGRRLKTWHKVKALQDEIRRSNVEVARSVLSDYSAESGAMADDVSAAGDASRNRSSTVGTSSFLPRGLEPGRQSADAWSSTLTSTSQTAPSPGIHRTPSNTMSSLQSVLSSPRAGNTQRPSAQDIRKMQHARRHSSIDSTTSAHSSRPTGHRKQPSIDAKWQPGQAMASAMNGGSTPAHSHTLGSEASVPFTQSPSSPGDLDRGYFSDNNSARKNVLVKKTAAASASASPMHSRASSFLFSNRPGTQNDSSTSLRDSAAEAGASNHLTNAVNVGQTKFGGVRSATSPEMTNKPMADIQAPMNPIVTRLEPAAAGASDASSTATPSPSSTPLGFFAAQKQKLAGLRSASDAVTRSEKSPDTLSGLPDELKSPTRTGSTTPSTETRSFDLHKSIDGQSRTSRGSNKLQGLTPGIALPRRVRPKTKKTTSAYTRGLEPITPAEQLKRGCDYSGWMKKKSGSLMSTWKPRLFILRGRRLAYYYSESDREEKGLIDISFHRVLPATNETLTGLHAAVTGAAGSPSSPTSTTPTQAEADLKANPPKPGETSDGLFIFKLVPPKSGLAKGVSFTKPTVHYFAVNSRQEGRLWMAALMKATIDRDEDGVVTTTYNQKTISLAKARARKERPPALQEEGVEGRVELGGDDEDKAGEQNGLGIVGLEGDGRGSAVGGVTPEPETPVTMHTNINEKVEVGSGPSLDSDLAAAVALEGKLSEEKAGSTS